MDWKLEEPETKRCPECGKEIGEGIEEWCYTCALYNGVINGISNK